MTKKWYAYSFLSLHDEYLSYISKTIIIVISVLCIRKGWYNQIPFLISTSSPFSKHLSFLLSTVYAFKKLSFDHAMFSS